MRVTGSHLRVFRAEDFLDQDCSVRELPSFPVRLRRTGRRVRHVHLISLGVENRIGAQGLVGIANVRWFANVSAFVDQSKSIGAALAL
jgi:hypothetical protein